LALEQGSLHRGSGLIPHAGQDVTVAVQGEGHERVLQEFLHELRVVAPAQEQGGTRVPEVVKAHVQEPHALEERLERRGAEVVEVEGFAAVDAEDEPVFLPEIPDPEALGVLGNLVSFQRLDG
jgi:hypothetical protein